MAKREKSVKKAEKAVEINKHKEKKQQELHTNIVIGVIIGLIILLIAVIFLINASNKFTYLGISFNKIRYGEIILYSANVPVLDSSGKLAGYMTVDFRNDPRKLRDINVTTNGIKFLKNATTYISVDPLTEKCDDSGIAIISFGRTFLQGAGISASLGSINETHAKAQNLPLITCQNSTKNTVIIIKNSTKTSITQPETNCYEINFKDCEILRAIEKFQLEVLREYREMF